MKIKITILFLLINNVILFSQHGVNSNWGNETILPISGEHHGAKQRGVLYNNNIAMSSGRIIISTTEVNPANVNMYYGVYLTYSDDGGNHWTTPKKFTPIKLVTGGSSPKLAIDSKDNIFVVWSSKNPEAIFTSILDKDLNIIKDSVRVANKQLHGNFAVHMTIDRKNRIHVMWHEGNPGSSQIAEVFYTRSTN